MTFNTVNENGEEKRKATEGVFLDKNGHSAKELCSGSATVKTTHSGVLHTPPEA